MPRTTGLIHHNPDLSRPGHQLVFAADGRLLADVGSFQRDTEEDEANAAHVVTCWNAHEKITALCDEIDLSLQASREQQEMSMDLRRLLKG